MRDILKVNRKSISYFILIPLFLTHCSHTKRKRVAPLKSIKVPSQKSLQNESSTSPEKSESPKIIKNEMTSEFYERLLDKSFALNETDIEKINSITELKQKSPVEEATAFVGHLRIILIKTNQNSDFVEESIDISENQTDNIEIIENNTEETPITKEPNLPKTISLEDYLISKNLDAENLLTNNKYLKKVEVFLLLGDVLDNTTNHESYVAKLNQLFENTFQQWKRLASKYQKGTNELEDVEENKEAKNDRKIQFGNSFADFKKAEANMVEAQYLANLNQYQEAIKILNIFPENHPFYSMALEKKKFYTNNAVQKLREKASFSYRQSIPVRDMKIKKNYLVEARETLLTAIKKYPEADYIDTVKENLLVIERDLQKIQIDHGTEY